jgi:hypothetical protein
MRRLLVVFLLTVSPVGTAVAQSTNKTRPQAYVQCMFADQRKLLYCEGLVALLCGLTGRLLGC